MSLVPGDLGLHLTQVDPTFERKRRSTYPGMAHFAGSGPDQATCRGCAFWTGCGAEDGYYAKTGKHGGTIKPRSCSKYRDMMRGDVGPGIPHDAAACKYFQENPTPPAIVYK